MFGPCKSGWQRRHLLALFPVDPQMLVMWWWVHVNMLHMGDRGGIILCPVRYALASCRVSLCILSMCRIEDGESALTWISRHRRLMRHFERYAHSVAASSDAFLPRHLLARLRGELLD